MAMSLQSGTSEEPGDGRLSRRDLWEPGAATPPATRPDPPMACSLSAGDLTVRLAEIAALGRRALLGVRDDGIASAFRV